MDSSNNQRISGSREMKELISGYKSGAREKLLEVFENIDTKADPRIPSGTKKILCIELDEKNKTLELKEACKQNGYDELFKTSCFKDGTYEWWDVALQAYKKYFAAEEDGKIIEFKELFKHSRLPTNSYIFFVSNDLGVEETYGHPGGFFNVQSDDGSLSNGRTIGSKDFHENRQEVIQEKAEDLYSTPSPMEFHTEERSTLNDDFISKILTADKAYKENKGEFMSKARDFDESTKGAVEHITQYYADMLKNLDENSNFVVLCNVVALKFMIDNTVSYKDNSEENNSKFKGFTTSGLNLENPEEREYALKHYQAVRDSIKLAILKYSHLVPEGFSELDYENKVKVLNEELGKIDDGRISPMRSGSPYCDANLQDNIEVLENAIDLKTVASIYNTPIPAIIPKKSEVDIPSSETYVSSTSSLIGKKSSARSSSS